MANLKGDEQRYAFALELARRENYEEYLDIIQKLSDDGFKPAQMCLGRAYFHGIGSIQVDYFLAREWHEKAISDDLPENYYWLSMLYDPQMDSGKGIPFKDQSKSDYFMEKAVYAMKKKAECGDTQSMHRLSELYSIPTSKSHDMKKAKYWLEKWRTLTNTNNAQAEGM